MIGYTDWSENGWKAVHDIQRKKLLKLFLKFTLKYFKKIWLTLGNKIKRNIKKRGSKAFAHHCMQWSLCHLSCTFVYKKISSAFTSRKYKREMHFLPFVNITESCSDSRRGKTLLLFWNQKYLNLIGAFRRDVRTGNSHASHWNHNIAFEESLLTLTSWF